MTRYATTILLALLCACGPGSGPTQAGGDNAPDDKIQALVLQPPNAVNVTAHGATPARDNIDERVFIQAAIDAACAQPPDADGLRWLYFPAGDYTVGRPTTAGQRDSLRVTCKNIKIQGAGQGATTIAMLGSGWVPAFPNEPGAWTLLHLTGRSSGWLEDLSLEGGKRTVDTEEQTHVLVVGDSESWDIRRVLGIIPQRTFPLNAVPCLAAPNGTMCETPNHGGTPRLCHAPVPQTTPPITNALKGAVCTVAPGPTPEDPQRWILAGWWGGGDCFRVFADPGEVTKVRFERVLGVDCDRAGFAGQRGVKDLEVVDSLFSTTFDSPWDLELTGGGVLGIKKGRASGVTLLRGNGGGGGYSATFGGTGVNALTSFDYDCKGGSISKGGVGMLDVDVVTLRDCHVNSGLLSELATFDARKTANVVTFIGGSITRPVGAPVGPVVSITHHTNRAPTTVILTDTTLVQGTQHAIIDAKSVSSLQMQRVKLKYLAAPWLKPEPGQPPPANHTDAAAILADTVPGSPQPVDLITMVDVTLEAPAGAFASLLRNGTTDTWPGSRRIVMAGVDVRGALRNSVLLLKGTAASEPAVVDQADILYDAPAFCSGVDCPAP